MDPEVMSHKPGSCPKCGMALERNPVWKPEKSVIYTCPMHPQIEQDHPGNCPICGMALEPKTASPDSEEDDGELRDMSLRFWIGAALTLPIFVLAMAHLVPALSQTEWVSGKYRAGLNSFSAHPSSCGPAGLSSSGAGLRWSIVT